MHYCSLYFTCIFYMLNTTPRHLRYTATIGGFEYFSAPVSVGAISIENLHQMYTINKN